MKHWKIRLDIQRFNDGYSLEFVSTGDNILIHRDTKEEIRQVISDNLIAKIDEVEAIMNPPEE